MRALLMIGALMLAGCQEEGGVTLEQYERIKTDMLAAEVTDVLGVAPMHVTERVVQLPRPYGFRDQKHETYVWRTAEGGTMTVMFADYVVVSKELDAPS